MSEQLDRHLAAGRGQFTTESKLKENVDYLSMSALSSYG